MGPVLLITKYFGFAFSALLPVINPLGSALVFLGLAGVAPPEVYRKLARRIAINTILFLFLVELVGAAMLNFFGISLGIMQVSGGLVLAAMGWSLLNQKDFAPQPAEGSLHSGPQQESIEQKAFYPLTFPVTAGPGCIVIMITLSAQASRSDVAGKVLAHVGVSLAVVALSLLVYLSYAYATRITRAISPSTAHGIVRVIAFILLCIGVQIAWNGLDSLLSTLIKHAR